MKKIGSKINEGQDFLIMFFFVCSIIEVGGVLVFFFFNLVYSVWVIVWLNPEWGFLSI